MNQAVKVGLTTGVATVLMKAGEIYAPHGNATALFQYAGLITFLAGTYVAIKRTRDLEFDGHIEFKLGLKAGVSAGTIAALLLSIFQYIALTHLDMNEMAAELKMNGGTDADLLANLRVLNNSNFFKFAAMLFAINIIISLFISVAGTLVLRKKGGLLGQ